MPSSTVYNDFEPPACELLGKARALFHTWFLHTFHDSLKQEFEDEQAGLYALNPPPDYIKVLPQKLAEAKTIIEQMVDKCSPAVLVDSGPLRCLPDVQREVIKQAVHMRYLQMNLVQPKQQKLAELFGEVEFLAKQMLSEWSKEARLKTVPRLLAKKSDDGRDLIERIDDEVHGLPRGIVLP